MMQKIYQSIIIFHLTSHRWTFPYSQFAIATNVPTANAIDSAIAKNLFTFIFRIAIL